MPSDFGISTLVTEAYADFVEGLSALSDGGQRLARDRAVKRSSSSPDIRSINIPGWDDVIHIVPRTRPSQDDKDAHYAAKRAGTKSPVGTDVAFEIERRGAKARAIQSSASPGWAQAAGQVLTALDNVQDLVTTVATVGRLTINPAIRAAELAATSRFATVAVGGRVAAKIGLRAIPLLGLVLTVGDLMKLVTQIGMLAFPAYALACAGPRAGLAAGIPALLMGPTLCKPIGAWSKINPFGRKAKLSRSRMARNWRPSIPNLIELAQTTDTLFGTGLSLGALTGLVSDTAFGIEQSNRGKAVEINTTGFADANHRVFSGQLARESLAGLHDLRVAATVLAYGPTLHGTQETFTVSEHIESLAATTSAMSILQSYLMADAMTDRVNAALDVQLEPPRYLEDVAVADAMAAGVDLPPGRRWPLPGSPLTLTGAELLSQGSLIIPSALGDLLRPIRDEVASTFIGSLVNQITERSAVWMTATDDAITYQDQPMYQIMTSLALTNRWPNVGDGEVPVSMFFRTAESIMTSRNKHSLTAEELDSSAKTSGLLLIHGLPPDAPYPAGFGT